MKRLYRAYSKIEKKMFYDVSINSDGWRSKDGKYSGINHSMVCFNPSDNIENHIYEYDIFNYKDDRHPFFKLDMNLIFDLSEPYFKLHSSVVSHNNKYMSLNMGEKTDIQNRISIIIKDYSYILLDEKYKKMISKLGNCYENENLIMDFKSRKGKDREEFFISGESFEHSKVNK